MLFCLHGRAPTPLSIALDQMSRLEPLHGQLVACATRDTQRIASPAAWIADETPWHAEGVPSKLRTHRHALRKTMNAALAAQHSVDYIETVECRQAQHTLLLYSSAVYSKRQHSQLLTK